MKKILISFDVDGTMVKPDYNELIWFKEIPRLYAKKHSIDFEKAKKLVIREYEKVGEDDMRWYLLSHWLRHFGFNVRGEEILEKYASCVELYPDVIPALDRLKRNYILIVASAMTKDFIAVKLRKEGLFKYFKRIFSAISDFSMIKKETAFYQRIYQTLGISPAQLIHIGDNYKADYLVPRKLGIISFYLNRNGNDPHHLFDTDSIVSDLEEFVLKINKDFP